MAKKKTAPKKAAGKHKPAAKKPVAKPAAKAKTAGKKPSAPAPRKGSAKAAPAKNVQGPKKTTAKPAIPKKPVKAAVPVKKTVVKPAPAKSAPAKTSTPAKPAAKAPEPKGVAAKVATPEPKPTKALTEKPAAPKSPPAPAAKKAPKEKEPVIAVMTGYDPIGGPAKQLKRAMKERYSVEFYLRATPGSLYDLISTPSGFSEWFCDDVDVRGDLFTFRWGSDDQTATCLSRKYGEMIRFHWEHDEDPGSFFEFRIRIDPMTNETCLVVTDHAWTKDMDESKALWASQIHTLQRVLGA